MRKNNTNNTSIMKKLFGIVLMVIGVLAYLFFRKYHGDLISYPILWYFAAIIIFLIGARLFIKSKIRKEEKLEESYKAEIAKLKETGNKLGVDFRDCEIVTSNYFKEVPQGSNYEIQAWDTLYDNSRTVRNVEISQSRVIYKYKEPEKETIFVSPIINKDKITLSFLLDKHKATTIFIDKDNKNIYYFDLEFLNE